ncbi:MAG: SpoIIE family protein phosphatase [Candidatus Eremiobacteraeota bacterium]|nr:SpoIIE family protein phosphatase [Candidatus Eremiobacteraeota bacterium]
MTPLDARAVENIAMAPPTSADRRAATAAAAVLVALFLLAIPFGAVRFAEITAFLPTVIGGSIVALAVTAVLLYVQYRIARDYKLALIAIAYGYQAVTITCYLLTFPHLFAPNGLLGAGPDTASCWFFASYGGFAAFVLAQAVLARLPARVSRNAVRATALGTVALLAVMVVAFRGAGAHDPALVGPDGAFLPLTAAVLVPAIAVLLLLTAVVTAGRFGTVAQVWLPVVLLALALALLTSGALGRGRFTLGWYEARFDLFAATVLILAVFLVKLNDLLLRLAARSRSAAEALAVGEARYASLANVVPQLIWTTNAHGDVEYVNDRWVAYTLRDLADIRNTGWRAVVHPDDEPTALAGWRRSLRTGEPLATECRLRDGATGRYRWFLVNAVAARDRADEIVAWIATCTDVDVQKRLDEREAFLARAGERLGASLDVTATVAALKGLLIPRLADRVWVALLDEEGAYVLVGYGSADAADEVGARGWLGSTLQPALHALLARAVARGEPLILDQRSRFPDPWAHTLSPYATMIAPLISGEDAIGALALVRGSAHAYEPDDAGLVREFARRAALSLEHARLYERERTTADALQRAMLPAQLPLLADVEFSASYSAASESQRVGGDFYDAFELPDGRVALTIGDVTGHGLEAAVIMGEIRQALRAASFESAEPSSILDRANRLLVASGRSIFVTAVVGVLDPSNGRFAYATAGHPPPLLQQGGVLRRLTSAGLPIGLRDDQGVDFALRLHAPCTLVLFTDGLMEFGRDLLDGERRIEDAMHALAREEIDHLAASLMRAVLVDDEPTDDIAILTMTVHRFAQELPGDEREWRFASDDGRTGAAVRREVGDLIARWTGRPEATFVSELAYGELVANAVRHAPGPVRVTTSTDGEGTATLIVEDTGTGFTAHEHDATLDPFAESGRGLNLVRSVSDDLHIAPTALGGTRVTVTFRHAVPALVAHAT